MGLGLSLNDEMMLESIHQQVAAMSAEELPALLGELETLKAMIWVRLTTPVPVSGFPERWGSVADGLRTRL